MREHQKRWLMSKMKSSGSRRKGIVNGRYADERNAKNNANMEELPYHEAIRSTHKFIGGKINYGPLIRFLRGQVGNDWDDIYSEIISRIPTKLLDHRDIIFDLVATKTEARDKGLWNTRTQKYIWLGEHVTPILYNEAHLAPDFIEFYVDPSTNKLCRIEQKSLLNIYKGK